MAAGAFRTVAVLGSGGMGTALAVLFARQGIAAALWARDPELAEQMRRLRENPRHLPGAPLPDQVRPTTDPLEAARGVDLVAVAIPSAFLRTTLARLAPALPPGVPVLSVVKGLEPGRFLRPSQVVAEVLGDRPLAVLSGPSHAEEIVRGLPASMVVAGPDDLGLGVQEALNQGAFRLYTNPDLTGVELAGALKNVLGVAAGICDGLGFGDNAKAALLTRGLVEITRFGVALGAHAETFRGLAGVGDLLTTCYSPFGRNRAVGLRIGRGEPLSRILASMTDVAEGVETTRSVRALADRLGIDMPITAELDQVLFAGKGPREALSDLMLRPPRGE